MTVSITTLSTTTLSIRKHRITTASIMKLAMTTLNLKRSMKKDIPRYFLQARNSVGEMYEMS